MTCGERTVRCLLGEGIDRVPFGVGIGWYPWGETLERWRREAGKPDLDPARELGFDLSFASPAVHAGIYPGFEAAVLEATDEFVVHRDDRGITRRDRRDGHSMPEFLDYPVKDPASWEILRHERLDSRTQGRIAEDWPAFRARLANTGEAVQVGAFPYGVFGTPRDLVGVELLLTAFYDTPALVADMMEHLTSLWLALWEREAAEVRIDHIHIWEDMSGRQGSLISPRMVRRFMMPCYDRIAAFASARGVRIVSVDTDGDCRLLAPIFMEHGVNMMFPFEVQAGNDVEAIRREHPTLGIVGGLDKRALAGSAADIDLEVARAARMIDKGRYIPTFDHLIPPDVPWSNFVYAADRLRSVCGA
jgi:uroporphyrinogen decarboxylase